MADKVAIHAHSGIDNIVEKLLDIIKPSGSTLIIARDILINYGFKPPVITDDWWLDKIEYSGTNPMEGTFQESMGWGRWGFPLPEKEDTPKSRGERLAWAAMQHEWQRQSEILGITQITLPEDVLDFIENQPGLKDNCFKYPHYLATYAPQLTIKGFGGDFENVFENWYQNSLIKHSEKKGKRKLVVLV